MNKSKQKAYKAFDKNFQCQGFQYEVGKTYTHEGEIKICDKSVASGDDSTAACDTNGFACVAGINGMVKGNDGSALSLGYMEANRRLRVAVAYVGENGIKPDVWYQVDNAGVFLEVSNDNNNN